MKGKYHFISGIVFLFLVFILDLFTGLHITSLLEKTHFVIIFTIVYLFFAGVLLPDSDKFGSWIFKFFFPLALTSWLLGFIFSLISGKKFRHRGFLHSVKGIFLSSLVSASLLFLILSLFLDISLFILIIFVFFVLLGQFIHLLFD